MPRTSLIPNKHIQSISFIYVPPPSKLKQPCLVCWHTTICDFVNAFWGELLLSNRNNDHQINTIIMPLWKSFRRIGHLFLFVCALLRKHCFKPHRKLQPLISTTNYLTINHCWCGAAEEVCKIIMYIVHMYVYQYHFISPPLSFSR